MTIMNGPSARIAHFISKEETRKKYDSFNKKITHTIKQEEGAQVY